MTDAIKILLESAGTDEQRLACITLNKKASAGEKAELAQAGAIGALIHATKTGLPITIDVAATTLCMFALEKDYRVELISKHSFHTHVLELIKTRSVSETTQGNLLGALLNLTNEETNRETMCTTELLLELVSILSADIDPKPSTTAMNHASSILWGLSKAPRNHTTLVAEPKVIQCLLAVCRNPPGSSQAAEHSMRCLRQLCQSDAVRAIVSSDPNVIDTICFCLTDRQEKVPSALAGFTTETSYEMARTKPTKRRFGTESEVGSILASMLVLEENGTPSSWWQYACGTLYELTADSAVACKFASDDAIVNALLNAIDHTLDQPLHRNALQFVCGALYNLTTLTPAPHAFHATLANNQNIEKLLKVFKSQVSLDPTRMFLAGIFNALISIFGETREDVTVRDAASLIAETNFLEDILEVILVATDEKLRTNLGSLLLRLISNATCHEPIKEKGLIAKVLNLIENNLESKNSSTELYVGVLYTLCSYGTAAYRTTLVTEYDVIPLLCKVGIECSGKTQHFACASLSSLSLIENIRPVLISRFCPHFARLVLKCEVATRSNVCGCLHNLMLNKSDLPALLQEQNMFLVLLELIRDLQPVNDEETNQLMVNLTDVLEGLSDGSDELREFITAQGCLTACVDLLLKMLASCQPTENLCGALAGLSQAEGNQAKMLELIPDLLQVFTSLNSSLRTRKHLSVVFHFVAHNKNLKPAFYQTSGMFDAICGELKSALGVLGPFPLPQNIPMEQEQALKSIIEHCCGTICDLTFDETVRAEILDQVVELLISAVDADKSPEGKVRKYACGALLGLSMHPDHRPPMVESYNVVEMFAELLVSERGITAYYACLTIQYLCLNQDNADAISESPVIDPLLAILAENDGGQASEIAHAIISMLRFDDPTTRDKVNAILDTNAARPAFPKQGSREDKEEMDERVEEMIQAEQYKHCTLLIREMATSENVFVTALKTTLEVFHARLSKLKNAKNLEVDSIFQNVPPILATHSGLLSEFTNIVANRPRETWPLDISNALSNVAERLKHVSPFIDNFDVMMDRVNALNKDKTACKVFEECRRVTPLNLQAHLIMPVQRIPRLVLFLKDLIKKTAQGTPEYASFSATMEKIEAVAKYCNDQKANSDAQFKISSIMLQVKQVPLELKLADSKRVFLLDGRLKIPDASQRLVRVTVYLFNDLIFWARDTLLGSEQSYQDHMEFSKQKLKIDLQLQHEQILGLSLRAPKAGLRRRPTMSDFDLSLGFALTSNNRTLVFFTTSSESKEQWTQALTDMGKSKKK